jgi:hypothetical protein
MLYDLSRHHNAGATGSHDLTFPKHDHVVGVARGLVEIV